MTCLIYFVSVICISIEKNLFTGRLNIVLVLAIFTIGPLISDSLLGAPPPPESASDKEVEKTLKQ